jgi:uncharacterized protein YjiS (DUF1127 family)
MACSNHAGSVSASNRAALLGIVLGTALGRSWALLVVWMERIRQRRALAELNDHLLRDIGVSRPAARREIDKLFWQP